MKKVTLLVTTGRREEWHVHGVIPDPRNVRKNLLQYKKLGQDGKMIFWVEGGLKETVAEKIPGGGGYFRIRQDGKTDLFLLRGRKKEFMWVLVNPRRIVFDCVEAAVDPLENYQGLIQPYTPLFYKVAIAHGRARGWNVPAEEFYSGAVMTGINGPYQNEIE